MREIKFRLWDKRFKQMELFDSFYEIQKANKTKKELEDMEIMQYTCLRDKNGKEIYEGDVIRRYTKSFCKKDCCKNNKDFLIEGEVIFDETMLCYVCKSSYDQYSFGNLENEENEIIGNIYENPSEVKE